MYAIVEIAGFQFKVKSDDKVIAPKMNGEIGDKVEFDQVLLIADNGNSQVGQPYVSGAKIKASILEHGRDKKVIIFKKNRRKGYKVKNGHRQDFTVLKIENIIA